MRKYMILIAVSLVGFFAHAEEPALTVQSDAQTKKWTRSELLKSRHLKKIIVESDPSYGGQRQTYTKAIPFVDLFQGKKIDPTSTIVFTCQDGFSGPLSLELVMNTDPAKAIAYVAIEGKGEKWPKIKAEDERTPGPFYLIWENPKKSNIGTEQWPFQVVSFEVKPSVEAQFPHTVPDPSVAANDPIRAGYKSFMKNCFACHTMNGEGPALLGPDLNVPLNPTEYLQAGRIDTLIRNPQNLRFWPQSKMNGFDKTNLSDEELQQIIAYLKHMAPRKAELSEKQRARAGYSEISH